MIRVAWSVHSKCCSISTNTEVTLFIMQTIMFRQSIMILCNYTLAASSSKKFLCKLSNICSVSETIYSQMLTRNIKSPDMFQNTIWSRTTLKINYPQTQTFGLNWMCQRKCPFTLPFVLLFGTAQTYGVCQKLNG